MRIRGDAGEETVGERGERDRVSERTEESLEWPVSQVSSIDSSTSDSFQLLS